MKNLIIIIVTLFSASFATAQKTISASKIDGSINIDGILNEEAWLTQNDIATDFTSAAPVPNSEARYQTNVKVLYDDEALYVAAHMLDGAADSVMQELTLRDDIGSNSDFFGILIDPYGNGTSAVELILSSSGVQFDAKLSPNNGDSSWDGVWYSATSIGEDGWIAELKIPFAVLRFPKKEEQVWHVNFSRKRNKDGTFHVWNNIDFEQANAWLTQTGKLEGIRDIKPPVRLSLTPYASVYGVQSKDPSRSPASSSASSYNMGMDIKYGINDAYTLDMTLIPDFGQAQSDDQVLNLSPFEVRFAENRAFFTEGLELFNKAGIFYSRRIGQNQQLYNATKLTGRNKNGLAIGLFNAVAKENATVHYDDELEQEVKNIQAPFSNYNIMVFDQDLKNNSSVSLTNTNVLRRGAQFHNANVTASTFNLKNKTQSFGVSGKFALSQIINKGADNILGHDMNVSFDKLNGSGVFGISYEETSDNYSHNDLGFFTRGNQRVWRSYYTHRNFDGFGPFNRFNYWANASYSRNIAPSSYSESYFNLGMYAQTPSFFQFNIWASGAPNRKNFFEPRTPGRHFNLDANFGGGYWFGTDFRKKVQFQSFGNIFNNSRTANWINASYGITLRYRVSSKLNIRADLSKGVESNAQGYVTHANDQIIFGSRDVHSFTNRLNINYTINNLMGFDVRLRHFWSKVQYHEFYNLVEDGGLLSSDYNNFHNLSFNAFTIDANYRWRFAPGSELIVNWKNNIAGVVNDPGLNYSEIGYNDGVASLGNLPQTNSISIRFSYFLDYHTPLRKLF